MENIDLSKRFFLRGRSAEKLLDEIRPPWSLTEAEFNAACTACGKCLNACPENIISIATSGLPELSFAEHECSFCAQCVQACPTQALALSNQNQAFERLEINIATSCLNQQGIICQSCCDSCDTQAIHLNWHSSIPDLAIDTDLCTFCGACISTCPANAIHIKPANQTEVCQ